MIKDSGERREFETGALRDMAEGKGRFDLAPIRILGRLNCDAFLKTIGAYTETGDPVFLQKAAEQIIDGLFVSPYHAYLELAEHFENGAKKYGEYNWQKGIESKSYIDSAVRHYCKHKAGWVDEPHTVACLWNLVCCIWTIDNKPELNSFQKHVPCVEQTCYNNCDGKCFASCKNIEELTRNTDCPEYFPD